jgi:hypothetical protein
MRLVFRGGGGEVNWPIVAATIQKLWWASTMVTATIMVDPVPDVLMYHPGLMDTRQTHECLLPQQEQEKWLEYCRFVIIAGNEA